MQVNSVLLTNDTKTQKVIGTGVWRMGAAAISGFQLIDKLEGEFIIVPGVAVSIQATSAAAILASITWNEVPI